MYKYKSICRFTMLIDTGSTIMEIRPQQEVSFSSLVKYPNLVLVSGPSIEKKSKKKAKHKEKINDNYRQASGT